MIGLAAGLEAYDVAWEAQCREEDMKQRALENERHAIDDARRSVDEKAEQLKVVANQSALFAGFSMIVLVESNVDKADEILLTIFSSTTALVVALMLVSTLNSTYILVAILRYDCVNRDVPFEEFWRKRCEPDWKLALRAFSYGVPLFMMVVALVPWVTFVSFTSFYGTTNNLVSGMLVSVIALLSTLFWFTRTARKWTGFLMSSEARLTTRRRVSRALSISARGDGEDHNDSSQLGVEKLSDLAIGESSVSEEQV